MNPIMKDHFTDIQLLLNGGVLSDYHVFSGVKYLGTLETVTLDGHPERDTIFIYNKGGLAAGNPCEWWRADFTPRRSGDVPKSFLAMSLLV